MSELKRVLDRAKELLKAMDEGSDENHISNERKRAACFKHQNAGDKLSTECQALLNRPEEGEVKPSQEKIAPNYPNYYKMKKFYDENKGKLGLDAQGNPFFTLKGPLNGDYADMLNAYRLLESVNGQKVFSRWAIMSFEPQNYDKYKKKAQTLNAMPVDAEPKVTPRATPIPRATPKPRASPPPVSNPTPAASTPSYTPSTPVSTTTKTNRWYPAYTRPAPSMNIPKLSDPSGYSEFTDFVRRTDSSRHSGYAAELLRSVLNVTGQHAVEPEILPNGFVALSYDYEFYNSSEFTMLKIQGLVDQNGYLTQKGLALVFANNERKKAYEIKSKDYNSRIEQIPYQAKYSPRKLLEEVGFTPMAESRDVDEAMRNITRLIPGTRFKYHGYSIEIANATNRAMEMNHALMPSVVRGLGRVSTMHDIYGDMYGQPEAYQYDKDSGAAYFPAKQYMPDAIGWNEVHVRDADFVQMKRDKSVKTGWHPQNTLTLDSTVQHEIGHLIDKRLNILFSREFLDIFGSINLGMISFGLSQYAANPEVHEEIISEAWAEYMVSPKPRKIAQMIGDFMVDKYFNTYGGP